MSFITWLCYICCIANSGVGRLGGALHLQSRWKGVAPRTWGAAKLRTTFDAIFLCGTWRIHRTMVRLLPISHREYPFFMRKQEIMVAKGDNSRFSILNSRFSILDFSLAEFSILDFSLTEFSILDFSLARFSILVYSRVSSKGRAMLWVWSNN